MLTRIAIVQFFVALALLFWLAHTIPEIKGVVEIGALEIEVKNVKLKLGYVVGAAIFAFLSRMLKLHDRISDVLGIRRYFDVHVILLPLAAAVGVRLGAQGLRRVPSERRSLMYDVFYAYVGRNTPAIDPHLIEAALDIWLYYWILLEAQVFLLAAAVTAITFGHFGVAVIVVAVALSIALLLHVLARQSRSAALNELEALVQDEARVASIRSRFNAL